MGEIIHDIVLEEIRERADIIEVISDYIPLKKAGRHYKGLCPFHQEKTPSFMVSEEKQLFHCFGCGVGGNVFTFLMKYEHISFVEAVKSVANRYGITIPEAKAKEKNEKRETLFRINAIASEFYVRQIMDERLGRIARDYLKNRGIERTIWEEYKLGYAPSRWDALVTDLKRERVNLKEAEVLGLIIPRKGGWYDRFRVRIIFPIFDLQDRVIGFGGRVLDDKGEPKYLNSPDSFLYKKGESLYGLNFAKRYIQKDEARVFIVEGYFDLLSMSQKGVKNVVATLGTALTTSQVRLLQRFGKEFFLLFDPDEAGIKATLKALEIFLREDAFPSVIPLPDGLDPDGYCQKGFPLQKLWQRSVPGMEYAMQVLMRGFDLSKVEGRAKAAEVVLPFLLQIKDGLRRGLYLKRLSEILDIEEREILGAALKMQKGGNKESDKELIPTIRVSTEKMLVQMMIQYPQFIPLVVQEKWLDGVGDQTLKAIAELVIHDFQLHGDLSLNRLSQQLEDKGVSGVTFNLAFKEEALEERTAEKIIVDCLHKIKIKMLKKEQEEINRRIKEAQARGDEALCNSLLLHKQTLVLQEERLKGA
jgi:DNA primase